MYVAIALQFSLQSVHALKQLTRYRFIHLRTRRVNNFRKRKIWRIVRLMDFAVLEKERKSIKIWQAVPRKKTSTCVIHLQCFVIIFFSKSFLSPSLQLHKWSIPGYPHVYTSRLYQFT